MKKAEKLRVNTAYGKMRRSGRYGKVWTIRQCTCEWCLEQEFRYRHYTVRQPDGSVYITATSLQAALNYLAWNRR